MGFNLPKTKKRDDDHSAEADELYRTQRDEAFRAKVAIQQFLNHNGPLFKAFAKAGTSINDLIDGDVLRVHASDAMRLASMIASIVHKKPIEELTAADAKPFRTESAEYVASLWLSNKPINVEKAAKEMAAAINLADKSWDHDVYRDDKLSDDTSLMISAITLAGSLSRLVDVYDFRLGKELAYNQVGNAVVKTASKMASDLLQGTVTEADRRNLTQTLSRNLSALMEACYERKAIEVAEFLETSDMTETEKKRWLNDMRPVDDILKNFEEWSTCFGALALLASQNMKAQNSPTTAKQNTP